MGTFSPEALARFRKICGLLGSAHDGERAAAALKATELLRQHGLGWADVGVLAGGAAFGEEVRRTANRAEAWQRDRDDMAEVLRRYSEAMRQGTGDPRRKYKYEPEQHDVEAYPTDETSEPCLRAMVEHYLGLVDAGELEMASFASQFLRDLETRHRWTNSQREAVRRTLQRAWHDRQEMAA